MTNSLANSSALIIDDFHGMRTMLKDFVKAMGVKTIDSAANARDAISALRSKHYDIVLCDFNLGPGRNGLNILEEAKVRKYIGYSTIWVMITAEKSMAMFMGAAEIKPDDYLLKPFNGKMLEARLNRQIEKKRSLRPIEDAVAAQNYLDAISLCDEQLSGESRNTQDLLRIKSELLMTIGDLTAARALFEEVLALRSVPWAKTGLGKTHFLDHDLPRAKEIFQEVLSENRMYLEAADWLAKTLEELGDTVAAQQVLQNATSLSPNTAARQKTLGDIAFKNGAVDLAQEAYEAAIKHNEDSVLKNPDSYAGLAKVLIDKGAAGDAVKILDNCRQQFKDEPEALLQAAMMESSAYQKLGQPEKAALAVAEAEKLMAGMSGTAGARITIDMAKLQFQRGEKDKAMDLLGSVVKNNHEDAEILKQVSAVFSQEKLGEAGAAMINELTQEVVNVNNQGVRLASAGKFEEGSLLLREAIKTLPNNATLLTNLCGMLLGLMYKNGGGEQQTAEIRELLERVRKINPFNAKYQEYLKSLDRFESRQRGAVRADRE